MNRYRFEDTNGAHIHLLDEKPLIGTTTALSIVAKTLTWWASGKALEIFGWTNPKTTKKEDRIVIAQKKLEEVVKLDIDGYIKLLDKGYRAHADNLKATAGKGTDLHAELERFVKDWMNGGIGDDYDGKIMPFILWAKENVDKFLWSEMYVYSEKLWVGAIMDVGWVGKDGKVVAGDFKSSREAYPTHFMQIAGGDIQFQENGGLDKDGNKILDPIKVDAYATIPFGAKDITPIFNYDIETCRKGFVSALNLYKINQQLQK